MVQKLMKGIGLSVFNEAYNTIKVLKIGAHDVLFTLQSKAGIINKSGYIKLIEFLTRVTKFTYSKFYKIFNQPIFFNKINQEI